jgi:hypothetical protein
MTHSASVLDFNGFRRVRDALLAKMPTSVSEKQEPATLDWHLPGFGGKARISTTFGELPIEALRVRDDLRTYHGTTATVQMVDKIHLDEGFIRKHQSALPIRVPANAFGPGRPMQDLILSPGQEICPDAHIASHFLKARELRARFGSDLTQSSGLTYFRFHCGEATVVRVEGAWIRVQP